MSVQNTWPYKYFTRAEMECQCGCKGVPTAEFMTKLDSLRSKYNKPMKISSGFRCLSHNTAIGGSKTSKHMEGIAVDILCNSAEAFILMQLAVGLGFGGIGVAKTFLHIDLRRNDEGRLWTY